MRQLGVLQLDSVNVFCRSHYVPVFSRLGPYDTALLDRMAAHGSGPVDRRLVEYWAHEASLIPVELHPLFRWRMADVDRQAWSSIARIVRDRPQLVADTLELVRTRGPIRARDTEEAHAARVAQAARVSAARAAPQNGQMWNWHGGKVALEHLFFTGQIAAARRIHFERRYDLTERVLPSAVQAAPTPPAPDAQRELVRVAARALGVAAEADLGDYFRLPRTASKARVAELAGAGELEEVEIEGWDVPAYLWPAARRPRAVHARALLSPFDSLIWFRPRTERLFGFQYRIEIYTPAPKRVYGYYVLPFLLGDTLVGRVDLKSDRDGGTLLVRGAFAEEGVDRAYVAVELAAEVRRVASWLQLGKVTVADRGDLAGALSAALG